MISNESGIVNPSGVLVIRVLVVCDIYPEDSTINVLTKATAQGKASQSLSIFLFEPGTTSPVENGNRERFIDVKLSSTKR